MNRIVAAGRGAYVVVERGGRAGVGECAPLPGRSPDRLDECVAALAGARAVEDIPPGLPAARFALETALLDLAAQERGASVAELLSPAPMQALPASAIVPLGGSSAAATWKVKIGRGDLGEELVALAAMRRGLRLDVNRAWSREQAARALPRLVPLEPAWVEEPVSAADLLALGRQPVPVALDESLLDQPEESTAALAAGLVHALVLKPALLGGHAACLTWAARARRAGALPVVSHLM
ncbi:MAG TPA: enolase C-terminal domain-like protein, partial [Kofleriaceae bacterium]|nr:enolase C-terminal domain-like protein [Kofleriaceae bacterium]